MKTKVARIFGADPEIAVLIDNKLTPPAAFIEDYGVPYIINPKGKKEFYKCNYGSVIEDGPAFEFNLIPSNAGTFTYNMKVLIREFENFLRRNLVGKNLNIKVSTSCIEEFDIAEFWEKRENKDLFLDCVRAGCDPDYFPKLYKDLSLEDRALGEEVDLTEFKYRFFGGHLHIQNMSSESDIYIRNSEFTPIVFDSLVGLSNITLGRSETQLTNEQRRMEVYGRPGRGRLQQYSEYKNGYEYRPPSNFWITNISGTENLLNMANLAATIVEKNRAQDLVDDIYLDIPNIWDIMLSFDTKRAETMLDDIMLKIANLGFFKFADYKVYSR
jgi:hypothetical protein